MASSAVSQAKACFQAYERVSGDNFTADWDASQAQTLGAAGLAHMSADLHRMSLEQWTFEGAPAPDDCALARDFDPNSEVMTSNCWFVTEFRPAAVEVKERYSFLNPEQMVLLQTGFDRARATLGIGCVRRAGCKRGPSPR